MAGSRFSNRALDDAAAALPAPALSPQARLQLLCPVLAPGSQCGSITHPTWHGSNQKCGSSAPEPVRPAFAARCTQVRLNRPCLDSVPWNRSLAKDVPAFMIGYSGPNLIGRMPERCSRDLKNWEKSHEGSFTVRRSTPIVGIGCALHIQIWQRAIVNASATRSNIT